jgi:peptidoglycan-associated lipoprotein
MYVKINYAALAGFSGGQMKKIAYFILIGGLLFSLTMCGKTAAPKTEPTKKQDSKAAEKVEEKKTVVERQTLTEEEIFQQKTIEQLNKDQVLKRINFDFDKYEIRSDMRFVLQSNADWLLKFKTVELLIEGHCDERGTDEYNIALGEKRAAGTKTYLVSLGISANRIRIISYGKNKPLVNGHDEDSYFMNRRCEFVIVHK